jgi:hypothetical protein
MSLPQPRHDKAAESAVILVEYGGVPRFLVQLTRNPNPVGRLTLLTSVQSCGVLVGEIEMEQGQNR